MDHAVGTRYEITVRQGCLVSKDLNLRLLSQGEGLAAEDYENDKISIKTVHTGFRHIGENPIFPSIYNPELDIPTHEFIEDPLRMNYIGTHNGKKFVIQNVDGNLRPVLKNFEGTIRPKNIEQRMAMALLLSEEIKLVSLVGKAGTGKTIIALGATTVITV